MQEEIEQMKGELAAKKIVVGLKSMLVSFGSRFTSLDETVKATQDNRREECQLLREENQKLLARTEYLEA